MIVGIGTDVIEISRIKKAAEKICFIKRVFTSAEESLCHEKADFYASLAVRFAGKEAVLKALGTGLRGCSWQDIEILSGELGEPKVVLSGGAKLIAADKNIENVLLSLSHSKGNAIAFCIAEGGKR